MRIAVCIKQIFDPATVRVTSRGELSMQDGVRIINPADLCALEEALRIKDEQGAQVIVIALGGREAEDALCEALTMGADRAILLSDAAFAGSDASAVSFALAQAVATTGNVDLVLTGARTLDDGETQIGPSIAEHLGWTQITSALRLHVDEAQASANQRFEDGDRRVTVTLPAVVTVEDGSNRPRLAPAASIMSVYSSHSIETWSAADIGADGELMGAEGALTVVRRSFPPEPSAKGEILTGTAQEAATALAARLRKRGLI